MMTRTMTVTTTVILPLLLVPLDGSKETEHKIKLTIKEVIYEYISQQHLALNFTTATTWFSDIFHRCRVKALPLQP